MEESKASVNLIDGRIDPDIREFGIGCFWKNYRFRRKNYRGLRETGLGRRTGEIIRFAGHGFGSGSESGSGCSWIRFPIRFIFQTTMFKTCQRKEKPCDLNELVSILRINSPSDSLYTRSRMKSFRRTSDLVNGRIDPKKYNAFGMASGWKNMEEWIRRSTTKSLRDGSIDPKNHHVLGRSSTDTMHSFGRYLFPAKIEDGCIAFAVTTVMYSALLGIGQPVQPSPQQLNDQLFNGYGFDETNAMVYVRDPWSSIC